MKGQRGCHSNGAVYLAYRQSGMGGRPDVNQPAAKPRLGLQNPDWGIGSPLKLSSELR